MTLERKAGRRVPEKLQSTAIKQRSRLKKITILRKAREHTASQKKREVKKKGNNERKK